MKICVCCNEAIIEEYYVDKWGQTIHTTCIYKSCFCCGRFLSNKGRLLTDNRSICAICIPYMVLDKNNLEWVNHRVLTFLQNVGIRNLPNLTIKIVCENELGNKFNKQNCVKDIYGFAEFIHTPFQKNYKIYLLDSLPKTLFAGVLAHEYLHIWQFHKNINPPIEICEGFCNLGSMLIYQKIGTTLSRVLLNQMIEDPDLIYGEGFRKMKNYLEINGWNKTISWINTFK